MEIAITVHKEPEYIILIFLCDQMCGILNVLKTVPVSILLSIDGLAALTKTTPTSDESQKDNKGIIRSIDDRNLVP
jgi:hypothetical protein